MKIKKNVFVVFSLLFVWNSALCFDTETHALITRQAYSNSVLSGSSIYVRLGLDRLKAKNIFNIYWESDTLNQIPSYFTDGLGPVNDNFGQGQPEEGFNFRFSEAFERCQMQEFMYPQIPSGNRIFTDTVSSLLVPAYSNGPSIFDDVLPVQNWLVRGAIREDDTGFFPGAPLASHCGREFTLSDQGTNPRSLNHFFDPYFNKALPLLHCSGCVNNKAVDWALGYHDSLATPAQENLTRLNHYTYIDARNLMWAALTREANKPSAGPYAAIDRQLDSADRMQSWATAFRALGDVAHLLEDMGQPQHTRNDPHASFNSDERQAFEDYTNDRVLGVTDESNSYVRGFFGGVDMSYTPPPLGSYEVPMFSTPVRFFTTSGDGGAQQVRAGLADYTNRGFFTGGTLPEVTTEPLPPHPIDTSYGIIIVPCEDLADADIRLRSVTCTHFTHAVPDLVNPNYLDELPCNTRVVPPVCYSQPPLASDSVFRDIIAETVDGSVGGYVAQTAIGIAELDTIGNMTIPRAVAYATGMINFFFRGKLEVTAPDDGVYSIINHGSPHMVDGDGIPYPTTGSDLNKAFGFESLRVNVKNTTENIVDSGSHISVPQSTGGMGSFIQAVARYHRNPCYTPSLTGQNGIDYLGDIKQPRSCASSRTSYQEISVSSPIAIAAGSLDGEEPILETFDFSGDPIPVNATDLFIQVVYKGQLGSEDGGIAVGLVDVSEPTYFSVYNLDYIQASDGTWSAWLPADPVLDIGNFSICFNGATNSYIVFQGTTGQNFLAGTILRFAVIGDFNTHTWGFHGDYTDPALVDEAAVGFFTSPSWSGAIRQATDEMGSSYEPYPLSFIRGFNSGDADVSYTAALSYYNGSDPLSLPSMWSIIPDINNAAEGLQSSDIGTTYAMGAVSCSP